MSKMIQKTLNKIYKLYLNTFFITIKLEKYSMIDYRIEIEQKKNIYIGERSVLYKNITIYKKAEGKLSIGKKSHIAPYGYFLMDKYTISIGNAVAIAKNCSFFCMSNTIPKYKGLFINSYSFGDIIVGDNVCIGTNCIVLPNTVIQNNVIVAGNSTIKGTLLSGWLYGGNPIRKIKKVVEG